MGEVYLVAVGDPRPVWMVARDWHIAVARELEAIARDGGLRTPKGFFAVRPKTPRWASRRAEHHRRTAQILDEQRPAFVQVMPRNEDHGG